MAESFTSITDEQAALIRIAPVFFVASVDPALAAGPHGIGPVNVSPKGGELLHILSPTRVAYVDFPGSGNETARHAAAGGSVTVMICSFDGDAAIVRLYGKACAFRKGDPAVAELAPPELAAAVQGARQLIVVDVERTTTSCGYGVPIMSFDHARGADERGRRFKPPR
jgi:predicted pyridoxine 5'-phosphate oxidase superfamily flavin-nucleotide-binding protein